MEKIANKLGAQNVERVTAVRLYRPLQTDGCSFDARAAPPHLTAYKRKCS